MSRSPYWSPSFWHSHQHRLQVLLLPHECYMPCRSLPPDLIVLLIIIESYEVPYYAVFTNLLSFNPFLYLCIFLITLMFDLNFLIYAHIILIVLITGT
jgi:hypothetical protein